MRLPARLLPPIAALALLAAGPVLAQERPSITRGAATATGRAIFSCPGVRGARVTKTGTVVSTDGKRWTVPAPTHFGTARNAVDLYNDCMGTIRRGPDDIDLAKVPILDAGGSETFTIYIFADNYFELYVNGRLLAVDAVPFTPFNSSVVRFKANRPFTVALMAVDWEENLGLGSEMNRGIRYHPGDGGLIAVIKDGKGETVAVTDGTWRAQAFYVAPLHAPDCLKLNGPVRDSSSCMTRGVRNGRRFYAAHWPLPPGWFAPGFDDSDWPMAREYTKGTVGVDNKPAYLNFTDLFEDPKASARFIWSSNLVLDNLVLMRKTVR